MARHPYDNRTRPSHPERIRLRKEIKDGALCEICNSPATDADHDHELRAWRGTLCHECNVGIGWLNDDPEILAAAIIYIIKYAKINGVTVRYPNDDPF